MKVLVFGSRTWMDQRMIDQELRKLPPKTILVHGAAAGADNIGGYVGQALGFTIRPYPADWKAHGKGAGPIRNQQMLDEEHRPEEPIDLALCFHDDPNLGKGGADMRRRLQGATPPIEVKVFLSRATRAIK